MQERSIPDQQAYVAKWAAERGYTILRWFTDDAISGTSTKGREAFERLIREAENSRDFDAILCYDISRFSRGGTNETGYYLYRLQQAGVQVVFCADGIPDGEEGELLQGVKSWQARQYSVKLSRDCIRGQHSTVTVRHSAMGGRAPYGYDRQYLASDGQVLKTVRTLPDGRREESGSDGKHVRYVAANVPLARKMKSDIVRLVPGDPEQIKVVRMIFAMCVRGLGFRSIVIELNRLGIPGPMDGGWGHMGIKEILHNPCYCGHLVWNRRTFGKLHGVAADGTARRKTTKESTRNPVDRWIVVRDVHAPLVSEEIFNKAQEEMARRRALKGGHTRPTQRYLLSGLLKCTHCGMNYWGSLLTRRNKTKVPYYVDAGYRAKGLAACRSTSIATTPLDQWVLDKLRQVVLGDQEGTRAAIDRFVKALMASQTLAGPNMDAVEKEIAAISKRIKSLLGMLTDTELGDLVELKATLVELKQKKQALEAKKAGQTTTKGERLDEATLRKWAVENLRLLGTVVDGKLPTLEMRRLVHAYVDRIEIDPDERCGTMYLPADAKAFLGAEQIRRVPGPSSSHSWCVERASSRASPRASSSGVSNGLTIPTRSDTSSAISGRAAPAE
jgi:DNA invertase Pin-like site-specific DNA recombinase